MFQSTRPQGARRRPTRSPPSTVCCFNPRARKGRDCSPRARRCRPASFNPRARKGRDTATETAFHTNSCFNPRARKGRDLAVRGERNQLHPVSIHAPARGATAQRVLVLFERRVSIHAPARGATIFDLSSDQAALVSIHAPARGATRWYTKAPARRDSFNPRARKGRDDWMVSDVAAWFQFQSTRPQGARPRGDAEIRVAVDVSIHAPARGATNSIRTCRLSSCSFNPRARKGRDPVGLRRGQGRPRVSIHAPARGAT